MNITFANRLQGFDRAFGFDRVGLVIDRSTLPGPVGRLKRECLGGLTIATGRQTFNPVWQCRLDLRQPTERALLTLIRECLGYGIGAQLSYAEVAVDIIVPSVHLANLVQAYVAERVVMRGQRDLVRVDRGTIYFSRRTGPEGGTRGRTGVVYSDRPSKIASEFVGQACVHLEVRLKGTASLAAAGLASVGDLLAFNHREFWCRSATLRDLPRKQKDLGRLLGPGDVSDSALRKRAAVFKEACSVGDQFFMHNAVRFRPELLKRLPKLSIAEVLGVGGNGTDIDVNVDEV